MANMHGYAWLIGPGKALDPSRQFLIATELFGNGRSSSPSNTPEPFHGPRFPVTTIRENVEAVHQLLTSELGVHHLQAVIGFSMGAQQAFQWAVSYPDFMDRIVATSGTARTYGHGIVRLESEITAITTDPAYLDGDYTAEPERGIQVFSMVWAAWLFSQDWWRQELWKADTSNGPTVDEVYKRIVDGFTRNDANDMILQARMWEHHDVGSTPGYQGTEQALRAIRVPVLYMPSETDLYFPVTDAKYEAQFIPHVTLAPIPSLWGHPAGAGASPQDLAFLNRTIGDFLKKSVAMK